MRYTIVLLAFIGLFPTFGSAQGGVTLALGTESAEVGETICVPVTVADFQNILSMQYTLQWDQRYLEFETISDFGLPWLSGNNFGTQKTAEGLLTVVWIDNSLQGVTKMDGQPVFTICFKVTGGRGQKAYVGFTENPTPFEVVNKQEKVVSLNPVAGGVNVK